MRQVAAVSATAFAALFATGCGRDADRSAVPSATELPYQAILALEVVAQPVRDAPRAKPQRLSLEPTPLRATHDDLRLTAPSPDLIPVEEHSTGEAPLLSFAQMTEHPAGMAASARVIPATSPITKTRAETLLAGSPTDGAAATQEFWTPIGTDAEPSPARIAVVTNSHQAEPGNSVYIPQISDSVRAAYIAQVDGARPGQRMAVRSGGERLGDVQFQVADGTVSVNIGQVLDLFQGRIDAAKFAALRGSQAAGEFVSLERLRSAGIPIEYNAAYDELTLG
jgi:hypothetical protein